MIIDIHTHTFPPALANRALRTLSHNARARYYLSGTEDGLRASMKKAGIALSVIQPVVTAARQTETINRCAVEINRGTLQTGLLSFGGIHPDTPDPGRVLEELKKAGVPGIKLHPAYQETPLDDRRYLRILEEAGKRDLVILIHGGLDVGRPGNDCASPLHIRRALEQVCPPRLILAHMGAWRGWDEAEEILSRFPVYADTAYTLGKIEAPADTPRRDDECRMMEEEQFVHMVRRCGAERILFGTDSPWKDQKEQVDTIRHLPLRENEKRLILGENAARLLKIQEETP